MASIASSITGITGGTSATSPGKGGPKHIVFLHDTQALNTNIHRPFPFNLEVHTSSFNLALT
jgi:hypothetical protein